MQQNLEALEAAGLGFGYTDDSIHLPELVNERWFDRYQMNVFLRREITRVYPVLTLESAKGTIEAVLENGLKTVAWNTSS